MNSSQSVVKIAGALLKAQKEMGDATKSARNPFYKSTYADLNSIREIVTPALNAQGVLILQPTLTLGEKNFVETILLHESGEFISGITEIKNTDGKPQSEGSGISYARRYGLQSILNVGAVDDDGEAAQGRVNAGTKEVKTTSTQEKPSAIHIKSNLATNSEAVKTVGTSGLANNPVKEKITEAFKVLETQKKISKEAFKTNYLNGKGLSTVLPSELPNIYAKLVKDFPHLSGTK
jgi:ERF superfamily